MKRIGLLATFLFASVALAGNPNTGVLPSPPDQTMDDSYMRVKMDLPKRIQSNAIVRDKTSDDWRFALDIGDGDFGAAVWGYPDKMQFDIGKNSITINDYDVKESFPRMSFGECRKHLAAGDAAAVWKSLRDAQSTYKGHGVEGRAGWLVADFLGGRAFSDYHERLDFYSGTATSSYKVDGREESVCSFASHDAEVMAIRPSNTEAFSFTLARNAVRGGDPAKVFSPDISFKDGIVFLHMTMPSGEKDAPEEYVLAVGCGDGKLEQVDEKPPTDSIALRAVPRGGKPATLYVTVVSDRDVRGPRADTRIKGKSVSEVAAARIRNAIAQGYDTVRKEHLTWWANYWKRSWIAMNEKEGEYPWYFGLYKGGSARRPGKLPPAYAAPWRGSDKISWSGRLCFDLEVIHYNCANLVSNHGEQSEPTIGTIWHTREKVAARTKAVYGMDGLCIPGALTNRGNIHHFLSLCMNTGSSGEAMWLIWDYYEFTQDKEFLRTVGYPLLDDVAEFLRQYLQEDKDGKLFIFPSYLTEYGKFRMDSITDLVNYRTALRDAAAAADILGVDADKAKAWRDCIRRMRPIATDANGLWLPCDPRYTNGPDKRPNMSYLALYPIFPGGLVNKWHGSDKLRQQAELNYRHWLGKHPEAWDKCFAYLAGARMGDRDYYPAMLKGAFVKLTEYGNITTSPEIGLFKEKGFSVDSGSAFPAGVIAEFLLNSQFGEIRVFPAMPFKGHYAFHSLRARGAFLVSSEFRDGKVPYILIKSLTGNPCKVIQPFDAGTDVLVRDLVTGTIAVEISNAKPDQPIEFQTVKGHIYVVERKDMPLAKVPVLNLKPWPSA